MKVSGLAEYKQIEAMGVFPLIPVLAVGGLAAATAIGLYGVNRATRPEFAQVVTQPITTTTQNVLIAALLLGGIYFIATRDEKKK